jgi:diadenosine tetraphosphate (Ap4A) HIT family hydrolase
MELSRRLPIADGAEGTEGEVRLPAETVWELDPQLARNTVVAGELSLSRVLVMNDANYPWLILVPRRVGVVEIIDLDSERQAELMDEIALISQVLKDITGCDKLNIAAIGNVVAQLHVHIVARRRGDPVWPRTVWGEKPVPYASGGLDKFIQRIRGEVSFG